jgi:hypothetical protein
MTVPIPMPPDLDRDPELAVLAVLETCVEAATHAVIAAQPGLRGPDPGPEPERESHWVALAFVHVADDLLRTIRAYRDALERERPRDDDYPF